MDKLWYLSKINIFDALPQEDLMEIEKMVPMRQTKKGTIVISPDKQDEILYFLKKGKVRIYKLNAEGKEFTLGILGDGNIFGEIDTFSTGTKNVYVETIENTVLCIMRKDDFQSFIESRPKLAYKLIQVLSERLRDAQDMMENLALADVKMRLIYLLLTLSKTFGIPLEGSWYRLDLDLTHQEIANMIGSTRETVSGILSRLEKEEIVKTRRKTICIDKQAAGKYINEE